MTDLTKLTAEELMQRCAEHQPIYIESKTFDEIRRRLERLEKLKEALEQERVRHAGCLTAAEGWAGEGPPKNGDYGWSPAFQAVMDLRNRFEKCEALGEQIEKLAEIIDEEWPHSSIMSKRLAEYMGNLRIAARAALEEKK